MRFSKVLAAYDGSYESKQALTYAAELSSEGGGKLTVITVVPPVNSPFFPNVFDISSKASEFSDVTRMRGRYEASLNMTVEDLRGRFPGLEVEPVLGEGNPGKVIVEEAERRGVDLLVVGSRGLGGVTGWVLGSTSRYVVENCTKPVLVVK